MERLHVTSIAAGVTHSVALTEDGALFFWVSSDPNLRCQQLHSLCGRNIVSVSAGKYWAVAVSDTGDVFMWDGKKRRDEPPIITRLHGLKKATSVSVGETHLLIVSSLYHPLCPTQNVGSSQKVNEKHKSESDELDEGFMFDDVECEDVLPIEGNEDFRKTVPSLKTLCERVAIEHLLEPRNSLQLLEIADSLGADFLRKHCEDMALRNLDYILAVSTQTFTNTSLDILLSLEKLLDLKSSEPWSYRRLPTPTATYPAIINSEEDDSENEFFRPRDSSLRTPSFPKEGCIRLDNFLQSGDGVRDELSKQVRALRKKLQQIEVLEDKLLKGHSLDDQQLKKIQSRGALESSLTELGIPVESVQSKASSSASADGRSSKKGVSRKQRRKTKQTAAGDKELSVDCEKKGLAESAEIILEDETLHAKDKDKAADLFRDEMKQSCDDSSRFIEDLAGTEGKSHSSPSASKKKKNRKGGLSMFLSGGLDDVPKCTVPLPTVIKSEGPAWGGAKISKGSSSLRAIQDEQSRIMEIKPTKFNNLPEDFSDGNNSTKIRLGSFLASSPIAVVRTSQVSDGEKNTPPWAASGTPPSLSRPSLRDIQVQQGKQHQTLSSPKTRTTGFAVTAGQGSPSDSSMNRWFKPEADTPSSIRSIQIEEKAIKDLKRFYSSVKVVKNPS